MKASARLLSSEGIAAASAGRRPQRASLRPGRLTRRGGEKPRHGKAARQIANRVCRAVRTLRIIPPEPSGGARTACSATDPPKRARRASATRSLHTSPPAGIGWSGGQDKETPARRPAPSWPALSSAFPPGPKFGLFWPRLSRDPIRFVQLAHCSTGMRFACHGPVDIGPSLEMWRCFPLFGSFRRNLAHVLRASPWRLGAPDAAGDRAIWSPACPSTARAAG
jgi:hypothetical protein